MTNIWIIALFLSAFHCSAGTLYIRIGELLIEDRTAGLPGAGLDLDPAENVIEFDGNNPRFRFSPLGYSLKGKVIFDNEDIGTHGLARDSCCAKAIRLTEFQITRTDRFDPSEPTLFIEFGKSFPVLSGDPEVRAAAKIEGRFENAINGGKIDQPGEVYYLAKLDDHVLLDTADDIISVGAGDNSPTPFKRESEVMKFSKEEGEWKLKANLSITLREVGDAVVLPDSAALGASPSPEPATLTMMAISIAGLGWAARRNSSLGGSNRQSVIV